MKNLVTKKNTTIFGIIGTLLIALLYLLAGSSYCYSSEMCHGVLKEMQFWNLVSYLVSSFPILLLSLVTYKMRDELFSAWIGFAIWWLPFSIFVTAIAPESKEGFISVPIKLPLALFCAGMSLAVSLGLVTWKWFALRKAGN